jgi:hypothetical protein
MRVLFGMAVALALFSMFDGASSSASAQTYRYGDYGPYGPSGPYAPRMRMAPMGVGPMYRGWTYGYECLIDDGYFRYHPCSSDGGGGGD